MTRQYNTYIIQLCKLQKTCIIIIIAKVIFKAKNTFVNSIIIIIITKQYNCMWLINDHSAKKHLPLRDRNRAYMHGFQRIRSNVFLINIKY